MQQPNFVKELKNAPDALDQVGVHFLPCTISKGGPCPATEYFKPEGNKVIIHGRELTGHTIHPPKPLYIFTKKTSGVREIVAEVKEFQKWIFHGDTQKIRQLVEYTKLLDALHAPIK